MLPDPFFRPTNEKRKKAVWLRKTNKAQNKHINTETINIAVTRSDVDLFYINILRDTFQNHAHFVDAILNGASN